MATQIVCEQNGRGPKCTRADYEYAEGEQLDCFFEAKMESLSVLNSCIADVFLDFNSRCRTVPLCNGSYLEFRCLDLIDFFTNYWQGCYCDQRGTLVGMRCAICVDPTEWCVGTNCAGFNANITINTLSETQVTDSAYGNPIPIIVGKAVVGGNIIWVGNARTEIVSTMTLNGDTYDITINQVGYCDIAIGFSAGNVAGIKKLWFNDTLVTDKSISLTDDESIPKNKRFYDVNYNTEFYSGAETQNVSDTIAADVGIGRTPAHRGLCYMVLKNVPTYETGGSLPLIRVELIEEIDESATNSEVSALGFTPDTSTFVLDAPTARLYTSDGTDIKVISTSDLSLLQTISISTAIPASLFLTPSGSPIVQRGDGKLVYTFGANFEEQLVSDSAVSLGGTGASIFAYDSVNREGFELVAWAQGDDISLFKINRLISTLPASFEWLYTHNSVTTGTFKRILTSIVPSTNSLPHEDKRGYHAVGAEGNNIVVVSGVLHDTANSLNFDATRAPVKTTLPITTSSLTLHDAFYEPITNGVVILATIGGVKRILKWNLTDAAFDWNIEVAELPANFNANTKYRHSTTQMFYYVASTTLYAVNLVDGTLTTSTFNGSVSGPQLFDSLSFTLYYRSSTNQVTKYFTEAATGTTPSAGTFFERVFTEFGLTKDLYDVADAYSLDIDGAIIADNDAIQGAIDFTGVAVVSSDKLKVVPLGTAPNTVVDEDEDLTRNPVVTRPADTGEQFGAVSVTYFGSDTDGNAEKQTISRQFLDEEYQIFTELEYGTTIYSLPTPARLAAERLLLRDGIKGRQIEQYLAPYYLAIEPGDYVNGFRVRELSIDTTLEASIVSYEDAQDSYATSPALTGVSREYTDPTQTETTTPIRNMPVILNVPVVDLDDTSSEAFYAGLIRVDDAADFVATPLFVRVTSHGYVDVGTPTKEVLMGRATSLPNELLNPFTTDYDSEIVVEFNRDLPADTFTNKTVTELYDSKTANLLFFGPEVLQFMNASVDIDNRTVTFTGLFRGRFGTDEFMGDHVLNEKVFVYDADALIAVGATPGALEGGAVVVATGNSITDTNKVIDSVYFNPIVNNIWPPVNLRRRDVSVPDLYADGTYFVFKSRLPYADTLMDDLSDVEFVVHNLIAEGYILNDVYDPVDFATERAAEGYALDDSTDVGTNPYILRKYTVSPFGAYVHYKALTMSTDGVQPEQSLSFVLVITDVVTGEEIITAADFPDTTFYQNWKNNPSPYSETARPEYIKHSERGYDYNG